MSCAALALASTGMTRSAYADDAPAEVKAQEEVKASAGVSDRWGTRGAATLGEGMAFRVGVGGSTAQTANSGFLNVEAGLLIALGKSFDLAVNLKLPMLGQFGVAPGIGARVNLIDDKVFHFALVANVSVPIIYAPGTWVGLNIEPGVMVSYFFSERVEFYSGILFAYSPLFINPWVPGNGHASFIGTFRAGLAYTLSTSNMGFFINADGSVGYEPIRRFIMIGDRGSGLAINLALNAGAQFKF